MEFQEILAFNYPKLYILTACRKYFPFAPSNLYLCSFLNSIRIGQWSHLSKCLPLGISAAFTIIGFGTPISISESLESLWHLASEYRTTFGKKFKVTTLPNNFLINYQSLYCTMTYDMKNNYLVPFSGPVFWPIKSKHHVRLVNSTHVSL